jgi:hypothetical protein
MSQRYKTENLIQSLTEDLRNPSPTSGWTPRYWLSWLTWLGFYAAATFLCTVIWPDLAYFHPELVNASFVIQFVLWLGAAVASAAATYQSSFPVWKSISAKPIALGIFSILLVLIFFGWSPSGAGSEFANEMVANRGSCGRFMLIMGFFSTAWMMQVIRRAAPAKLFETGAWAAATSGAVGALCMRFVCPYENPAHILVWHLTPILALSLLGAIVGKKALRWR